MVKLFSSSGRGRAVPNPFSDLQFVQYFSLVSTVFALIISIVYILEKNKKRRLEHQLSLEKKAGKTEQRKFKESLKNHRSSIASLEASLDKSNEVGRKLEGQLMEKIKELDVKTAENRQLLNDRMDRDFVLHEAGLRFQNLPQEILKIVQSEVKTCSAQRMMAVLEKMELWKKITSIYLDPAVSKTLRRRFFNLILELENVENSRELKNAQIKEICKHLSPNGSGDQLENVAKEEKVQSLLTELRELDQVKMSKVRQLSFLQDQFEHEPAKNSNSTNSNSFSTPQNSGQFNENVKHLTLPRKSGVKPIQRSNSLSLPWNVFNRGQSQSSIKGESFKSVQNARKVHNISLSEENQGLNLNGTFASQGQGKGQGQSLGHWKGDDCFDSSVLSQDQGDFSPKSGLIKSRKHKIPAFLTKLLKKGKTLTFNHNSKSGFPGGETDAKGDAQPIIHDALKYENLNFELERLRSRSGNQGHGFFPLDLTSTPSGQLTGSYKATSSKNEKEQEQLVEEDEEEKSGQDTDETNDLTYRSPRPAESPADLAAGESPEVLGQDQECLENLVEVSLEG